MKILINTSNLVVGGGLQVAVSVINELRNNHRHQYFVVLSPGVAEQVDTDAFPANFAFEIVGSPARLSSRRKTMKRLQELEAQARPDVVLSVFGPSYWRPRAPHICGFALGWFIHPESPAHDLLNTREKFKHWLVKKYKWAHLRKETDYLWCETADVRQRLNRVFDFPLSCTFVVGNTFSSHFQKFAGQPASRTSAQDGVFKLLTVSAYYPHKNLEIIKQVIPRLVGKMNFCFILTIPVPVYQSIFNEVERAFVKTLGAVTAAACPGLYAEADAVFLPTLLECFSANYPEAMVMRKPILTSDLSFATGLLGAGAIYFNPLDADDIAGKILQLATSKDTYNTVVAEALKVLPNFMGPADRASCLISLCERVADPVATASIT